jgi:transposase
VTAPSIDAEPAPTDPGRGLADRDPGWLEARRRKGVELLGEGLSQVEVARRLGVSRAAVCQWRRAAARFGATGLRARARRGRPSALSQDRLHELAGMLRGEPRSMGVGADRWSAAAIRDLVAVRWGLRVSESTVRRWHRQIPALAEAVARTLRTDARGWTPGASPPVHPPTPRRVARPPFVQFILAYGRLPSECRSERALTSGR